MHKVFCDRCMSADNSQIPHVHIEIRGLTTGHAPDSFDLCNSCKAALLYFLEGGKDMDEKPAVNPYERFIKDETALNLRGEDLH